MPFTTVNIVVLTPMASANVSTATAVIPAIDAAT
jgi:hypothetical protein